MIIDASVVLMAFFPDEVGHVQAQTLIQAYVLGIIELHSPTLLSHEITNAVLQAVRRQRIDLARAHNILIAFEDLMIPLETVSPTQTLSIAHRYHRSAYDAAYLALAERLDTQLITGDRRLYNAVSQQLSGVIWIGDYTTA